MLGAWATKRTGESTATVWVILPRNTKWLDCEAYDASEGHSGCGWQIWSWDLSSDLPCSIVQMQLVKMQTNPATEFICDCEVASAHGVQLSPHSGKLLQRQQWYLVWCY